MLTNSWYFQIFTLFSHQIGVKWHLFVIWAYICLNKVTFSTCLLAMYISSPVKCLTLQLRKFKLKEVKNLAYGHISIMHTGILVSCSSLSEHRTFVSSTPDTCFFKQWDWCLIRTIYSNRKEGRKKETISFKGLPLEECPFSPTRRS